MSEAVTRSYSIKKLFLKLLQNSQDDTCARGSFLMKLQTSGNFIKNETLAPAFFLKKRDLSTGVYFVKYLGTFFI